MKTINLTAQQFAMSPRQIVLMLRYGEQKFQIQHPCSSTIQEIEKLHEIRAFSLESVDLFKHVEFHISTGKIYYNPDGWIERFIFRGRNSLDTVPHETFFIESENRFLANLIQYILRKNKFYNAGIRTIHNIHNEEGKLLRCYSVIEELYPLKKIKDFFRAKIAAISKNLNLSDNDLDPCHSSYTGRYFEYCSSCPCHPCKTAKH